MDLQFWWMLLKIVIFLPFIIFLIYASVKYGGNKLQGFQNGKYIKILERTPLSKENSLLVVKIGEKGFVMASSNGNIEMLSELSTEELAIIEASKTIPQYDSLRDFCEKNGLINLYEKILNNFHAKLRIKKEDRNNEKDKEKDRC